MICRIPQRESPVDGWSAKVSLRRNGDLGRCQKEEKPGEGQVQRSWGRNEL